MKPRRHQTPVTIRSDRAAKRLALLTRDGRSQAEVIEDALDRAPVPPPSEASTEAVIRRIDELSRRIAPRLRWRSIAEFDEQMYDERGFPR